MIVKNTLYAAMEFSRCAPALVVRPNENTAPRRGLSKLSSARYVEVDVVLGELVTGRSKPSTAELPPEFKSSGFPRKEVIQPQLPLRLPCYDFTPITGPTFDGSLLAVRPPASGVADSRDVTGGVYKARERIHRGIADPRLLATPPS